MENKPIIASGDNVNGQSVVIVEATKTNSELLSIILNKQSSTELKQQAAEQLLKNVGVDKSAIVDEQKLIKEIAQNVLERPGSLNMGSWHCGTSHCLAGWACVLNPVAQEIEKSLTLKLPVMLYCPTTLTYSIPTTKPFWKS